MHRREVCTESAVSLVVHRNEEFYNLFTRELEKKSKTEAYVVVEKRLLFLVHSIMRNRKPYKERKPEKRRREVMFLWSRQLEALEAIHIADRAFGRSKSLDLLDRNQYITAPYRWDQPYRDILMETDFTGGHAMNDMIIKNVIVRVEDVMKEDSTGEQMKLAGRRRYIAIYNMKREELDLKDLNDKIDGVNRKISKIPDQKDLKKSMGKLKSFVKFSEIGAVMNEKKIDMMKRIAGRFLIVTNTDLPESEIVTAYKEQWQIERSFRTTKSFLEIRPVYHRKPDRIKAHVFVCVRSLLLSRIMEKRTGRTIDSIRKDLNCLDVVQISVWKREICIFHRRAWKLTIP